LCTPISRVIWSAAEADPAVTIRQARMAVKTTPLLIFDVSFIFILLCWITTRIDCNREPIRAVQEGVKRRQIASLAREIVGEYAPMTRPYWD
jgi:hypothetical protein